MHKPKLILASASIGRKSLLTKLGVPFSILPSTINEDIITHSNPYKTLQLRARAKAEDVTQKITLNSKLRTHNYLIIAADSMAVLGNKTYGKAKDKADAKRIISKLMGKTHVFATATCIIHLASPIISRAVEESVTAQDTSDGDPANPYISNEGADSSEVDNYRELNRWEDISKSRVTLGKLDASSLEEYVSRYNFTRFAAGYALNETPWDLVTKIDGSYTNVIGLPFEILLPILFRLKII